MRIRLKNAFRIFQLASILCIYFSCNQVKVPLELDILGLLGLEWSSSYQYPQVVSISPIVGAENVGVNSQIIIDFSKDMDKKKVESSIQLFSPGGNTDYRPSWVFNKRLLLSFPNGLTVGKRYEITLNANTVQDIEGNKITKNFLSSFVTEGVESLPEVTSSDPAKSSEIYFGWSTSRSPSLNFSEPMDPTTTNNAVSITGGPALYLPIWNTNFTQLTLHLRSPLDLGRTYTLGINTSARSSKGIALKSAYFTIFSTSDSLVVPELNVDVTLGTPWTGILEEPFINSFQQVSRFDTFRFIFSEPMDIVNINGQISFSPHILGNFQWLSNSVLTFSPTATGGMITEQLYRMSIRPDFLSSSGIKMNKSYTIDFRVNDPFTSEHIQLVAILGRNYSIACIINPTPEITIPIPIDNTIAYEIRPRACPIEYQLEFQFNTSGSAPLVVNGLGSIYENTSIEYISGNSNSNIHIEQIDYMPSANPQRVLVRIRGISANSVRYLMKLNGGNSGVKDSNGNNMLNNHEILFYGNFL